MPSLKSICRWLHPHVLVALLGVVVLLIGRYELWGPKGFIALHAKQQEYQREIARVKQLEDENKRLHRTIDHLKADPSSIERIAREELHLAKPGEVVYTYPEDGDKGPATESARR
jgi:cell division protein FtsB